MHYVDFAENIVREIDQLVESTDSRILSGAPVDLIDYRACLARRRALLEVRELIVHALGRNEAR